MKRNRNLRSSVLAGFIAFALLVLHCGENTEAKAIVPLAPVDSFTFVHPGIINTRTGLDQIASELNKGNQDRVAAFQKVIDFINIPGKYPVSFPQVVVVGSNGATTPSKAQIRSDAELVYAIALRWAASGNKSFADQAIAILNGWASGFQSYGLLDNPSKPTNPNQPSLEASWTMPTFAAAAEIIRYYKVQGKTAGWQDADVKKFEAFLRKITYEYIDKTPVYNNNWNVSAGYAKMAIGVFLNDREIYQSGLAYIQKYLPVVIAQDGTIEEMCKRKDCVHYQYSLTGFSYAAEIARIQGDSSVYQAGGQLLSKGYDFMRKAYDRNTGCDYCSLSSPVFPGVEVAYRYYKTKTLRSLREIAPPYGLPNDNTFLGFTTYTHFGTE